jgi:hypothetical protein
MVVQIVNELVEQLDQVCMLVAMATFLLELETQQRINRALGRWGGGGAAC